MTDRRVAVALLAAAILALVARMAVGPVPVAAQTVASDGPAWVAPWSAEPIGESAQGLRSMAQAPWPGGPLEPAALSVLIPGAGQLLALDQRRGWAYLAVEALGWIVYAERRAAAGRYQERYRELAWDVARLADGPRVDGDFEFYERMSSWLRSGRFDVDPETPGLQPEPDPATFNGSVWQRARGIYSVTPGQGPADPAYRAAVEYYETNAYADAFRWDWTGHADALQRYDALIGESDERFRQATVTLGVVIANHLVSAVDAYVSARGLSVGVAPGPGPGEARILIRWTPFRRADHP